MLKPSQIPLFKSLLRRLPKPVLPFSVTSLSPIPTQLGRYSLTPNFPQTPPSNFNNFSSASKPPEFDKNRQVDTINLKFAEAREEIEMAMESKETVYFDEEAECARIAVKEVLDMFDGLLNKVPDADRASLQRSMGLKMEQLKAELQQLNE